MPAVSEGPCQPIQCPRMLALVLGITDPRPRPLSSPPVTFPVPRLACSSRKVATGSYSPLYALPVSSAPTTVFACSGPSV